MDLRGYGESEKPVGVHNYTEDALAQDLKVGATASKQLESSAWGRVRETSRGAQLHRGCPGTGFEGWCNGFKTA